MADKKQTSLLKAPQLHFYFYREPEYGIREAKLVEFTEDLLNVLHIYFKTKEHKIKFLDMAIRSLEWERAIEKGEMTYDEMLAEAEKLDEEKQNEPQG